MTTAQLNEYIGQTATLPYRGLSVRVIVKDVKQSYGRVRLLVQHADGERQTWVNLESVKLEGREK
jgi:hypothetical protein